MWGKSVKSNKLLIMIIISLVIVGIIILINFFSFSRIDEIVTDQLRENQLIKTEYAANKIESHIKQVKDELITISKFPIVETPNINECSGDMGIIHEEGKIDSLLRANSYGNVIECSSPDFSNYLGLNIKNKDYFKIPKETNEPFVSGIVRQGTNKQIIVSVPLFETTEYTPYPNFIGKFKGVLLSIVEVSRLYTLYLHPVSDPEKNLFLLINLNTEETILKSNNIKEYIDVKKYLPALRDGSNIITKVDGLGKTILTSSDLIFGSENWRLIVLTPLKNVGKEIESVQIRNLFSLGFVILVIIVLFFLLISLYQLKEKVLSKLEKTNITLEKLGINIEVEKDKYNQADISLDAKKIYLVKEDDENHAHELFISSLNKGFAGLGIVREDPRDIRKMYNLQKTSFIWLTNNKEKGIPCETNIDNLFKLISEFVEKSKKSVILLDRLDYVLSENKFEDVIKKIHALKDLVLSNECIIILSGNPELIEESKLSAIEVETIDLYGKHLKKKVALSNMEMDMLKYINEANINNRLVSYKDVTENFKITKPTTRSKLNDLHNLGLIQIEQKGRFKSLKITSTGRKIIV